MTAILIIVLSFISGVASAETLQIPFKRKLEVSIQASRVNLQAKYAPGRLLKVTFENSELRREGDKIVIHNQLPKDKEVKILLEGPCIPIELQALNSKVSIQTWNRPVKMFSLDGDWQLSNLQEGGYLELLNGKLSLEQSLRDYKIRSQSSSVNVTGVRGDLVVEAMKGSLLLQRNLGSLQIRSHASQGEVKGHQGRTELKTESGNWNLMDIKGDLEVLGDDPKISLELGVDGSSDLQLTKGKVSVGFKGALQLDLWTKGGRLTAGKLKPEKVPTGVQIQGWLNQAETFHILRAKTNQGVIRVRSK